MVTLIFPPAASPTYLPLGVSSLKSYIDSRCGAGLLQTEDMNIRYWDYLCTLNPQYGEYRDFVQGKQGVFSKEFYEPHLPAARALRNESSRILELVSLYLDRKVLDEDLEKVFLHLWTSQEILNPVVMFSCLFPDQLLFTLGFSRWLTQFLSCPVYIGGASALLIPPGDLLSSAPWIKGIFTGEGEAAMESFIRHGGEGLIPGFYRRGADGSAAMDAPPSVMSMEDLPAPDFSWTDLSSYYNPVPVLPVQLSRGCKWRRCRFCAHNFSFGRYRCTDVTPAVDLLSSCVKDYGASRFYITDQYLDGEFLEPFAREIIARGLKISYTFMGRPAEDMTPEVMSLLAESGCAWISWGVETGSARLLDTAGKGTNPATVSRVLKDSKKAGINNLALMIFGLPESDDQALEETFEFLQENREWIDSLTASEFQLYLGTPFGNHPERYQIEITGPEAFCRIDGRDLVSVKVKHTDLARGDEAEILRGPHEARRWRRRKIWIYPDTFWDALPSEHYLILNSRMGRFESPDNPENTRLWNSAV